MIRRIIFCVWVLAVWAFFQFGYENTFFYKEQNQIFLTSTDYMTTYFDRPAWCANMVGDFLTQFYYYLYAGAAIFTVLLVITFIFIDLALLRITRWRNISFAVSLAIVTCLAIFNFNPDYRTSSVVSLLGTALLLFLWTLFRRRRMLLKGVIGLIFIVLAWWMFRLGTPAVGQFSAPYFELEDYLEVDNLYYFGRDDALAAKVEAMDEADVTSVISCYYYMSKSRQGELTQSIGKVSPVNLGTLYHIGPKSSLQEMRLMNEFYFLLGDMTMTERAAMLVLVSSHNNRNIRAIKRLAEVNLVAGDAEAAMKYLRILEQTFVYRKWALANRPERFNNALLAKRKFVNKNDRLRLDDNCREILIGLLEANPDNRVAANYLLCTDIQVRNRQLFFDDYRKYYRPSVGAQTDEFYKQYLVGYE